jgi:hypothetical protein
LSLNPDSSEDHELKIKGLADIKVGDYTRKEPERKDGLGSLLPVDIEAIAAAKVTLAVQVEARRVKVTTNLPDIAIGEIDIVQLEFEDKDEHEEVLTLGRMYTQSQVQVNRYYTAAENKEGVLVAKIEVEDNRGCNKTSVQYYLVISDCQRFTKELKDQKDLKDWEDQEDRSYVFSLCSACVQLCSACVQLALHSPNPLRLCYHSCILYSVYKNCGNSTS